MNGNGHWKFPEQMGKGKKTGFVYVMRHTLLERFYLGKKFYKSTHKGRTVESDWRNYMSSSNTVKAILKELDKSEFEFIVLEEYEMRGAVSYAETWSLCHVEAPTTDTWYNKRIEEITWNVREPITQRHKDRLQQVINMEPF